MKSLFLYASLSFYFVACQSYAWVSFAEDEDVFLFFNTHYGQGTFDAPEEHTELLYSVDMQYRKDEVAVRYKRIFYYATQEDIQNHGQGEIYFNAAVETVKIHAALSVYGAGERHELVLDDIKVIDSDTYDVFSSGKRIVVPYNGLREGGFTLLDYSVIYHRENSELDWFENFFPQVLHPRSEFTLSVDWGDAPKPNFSNSSDFLRCEEQTGAMTCVGKNIPAAKSDSKVYWRDELGIVSFSEFYDWQAVVSRSSNQFAGAMDDRDGAVQSFVDQSIESEDTIEGKIKKLHEFVARDIRYLSRSEVGNAYTPHLTKDTLQNRLGDCKDKSALFIDMLNRLGLEAWPVLVSTRKEKFLPHLPSLAQFNHAIVCFTLEGNERCVDLTDTQIPWHLTPSGVQGKYALAVKAGAEPHLLTKDEFVWRENVETVIVFEEDGAQKEHQIRRYLDHAASDYRAFLSGLSKDETLRKLVDGYQQNVAASVTPEMSIHGLALVGEPVMIESRTTFDPFLDTEEAIHYTENDAWIRYVIDSHGVSNQVYGISISGSYIESVYRFDFSKAWKVTIAPADLQLTHKYGSLTRTSKMTDSGQLEVKSTLRLPSLRLGVNEIKTYNDFLNTLKRESLINVLGDAI